MKIDQFMPRYDFNEVHTINVKAPPSRVYTAIKEVTASDIRLFRVLMGIRMLPARLSGKNRRREETWKEPLLEQVLKSGFVLLADEPGREVVLGTIGQFWKLAGGTPSSISTAEGYIAFKQPNYARAAMNFYIVEGQDEHTRIHTETRIRALSPSAHSKFRRYWRVVYPGSALIRVMWLRAIKRRAEWG